MLQIPAIQGATLCAPWRSSWLFILVTVSELGLARCLLGTKLYITGCYALGLTEGKEVKTEGVKGSFAMGCWDPQGEKDEPRGEDMGLHSKQDTVMG